MVTNNIDNCNERIRISVMVLIFYIILSALIGIDVTILMVFIYALFQLLLCLKQKIKPMSITIFNIIVNIIFIISILPTFISLFNQTFNLTWEHYIVIILVIYVAVDQFNSKKSELCITLPYICLMVMTSVFR